MKQEIYQQLVNDNCYMTKTDINGIITFANDNFCKKSGFSKEELIGSTHAKIKSPDTNPDIFKDIWDTIQKGGIWKGIIKNCGKDGNSFFMDTSIYPVKDKNGKIKEFVSFRNDLTHYIDLLTFDRLTGLKNRESLKNDIVNGRNYLFIVINIDSFSEINEFYGGLVGDKVIIETASRLKNIFKGSIAYRLQGDEFGILKPVPGKYKAKEFISIAINKIKSIFEDSYIIEDIDMHITATSGISIGKEHHLRNANLAFKNAKMKNIGISVYEDEMLLQFANFSNNKKVAGDIKEAIKQNQIIPYYQPIIDNLTGKVAKYEALARLIKEDDIIPPGEFINVSKKIKYYHKITRAILEKGFENFGGRDDVGFSVNLTIEDIANIRTYEYIIGLLNNNKKNNNITFEIVESNGIEDFELFDKFVTSVKKQGAKISIDDFGTGYSNFSYLAKIEPDFLKIDGSLIKNIENKKDFDVVRTIVDFAKMYNIKTVAEYVESENILKLIKELGIDYSQGYYFDKPLSIEEIKQKVI